MRNKAQLGNLQTIIIALVVIGLILGIGFLVMEEFQDNLDNKVATIYNETLTTVTEKGEFANKNYTTTNINCYNSFTVISAFNATNVSAILIPSSNYTVDAAAGKVSFTTGNSLSYNNTDWNITYTFQYGNESCGGVESTINVTSKIPTWLAIVVILLIVGILLAIVFRVLPSAGGGGGIGRGSSGGTVAEI